MDYRVRRQRQRDTTALTISWRAMSKADIPAVKEPSGLLRTDDRRPDGVTLIPWKDGRCVAWHVTVTDTMAQSYLPVISQKSSSVAEAAADRKTAKYEILTQAYIWSWRLQLKPRESSTATVLNFWTT